MFDIFKKDTPLPIAHPKADLVHFPVEPNKMEMRDIEKSFARLFASDDGQKVLSHLQVITFHRALGPGVAGEHLRYMEGQRAMIATILRLIDRGRKPQ